MKVCPVYAIGDCPYCRSMVDDNGERECFCSLVNPEEECDDYMAMMGEE